MKIIIAITLAIVGGFMFGRLSYAHVCTCTTCTKDLDCKPHRNRVLTQEDLYNGITDVGFMEHGAFGSLETYHTLEKINPYDWDKNQYFTGDGWSTDKSKAMKANTTCELNNVYLHYQSIK